MLLEVTVERVLTLVLERSLVASQRKIKIE